MVLQKDCMLYQMHKRLWNNCPPTHKLSHWPTRCQLNLQILQCSLHEHGWQKIHIQICLHVKWQHDYLGIKEANPPHLGYYLFPTFQLGVTYCPTTWLRNPPPAFRYAQAIPTLSEHIPRPAGCRWSPCCVSDYETNKTNPKVTLSKLASSIGRQYACASTICISDPLCEKCRWGDLSKYNTIQTLLYIQEMHNWLLSKLASKSNR